MILSDTHQFPFLDLFGNWPAAIADLKHPTLLSCWFKIDQTWSYFIHITSALLSFEAIVAYRASQMEGMSKEEFKYCQIFLVLHTAPINVS